jgi:hypothetical protein
MLRADKIAQTVQRLRLRIADRFPGSGLSQVSGTLLTLVEETSAILAWIDRPHWCLRLLAGTGIVGIVAATVVTIWTIGAVAGGVDLADLVQMAGAGLEGGAFAAAGIVFLVTVENRQKRRNVIAALNRLRCIAHLVDAHQLTKDPEATGGSAVPTANSPRRDLSAHDLGRYLDYCSEMLALIGKVGFLYIQRFPDPVATDAVNDLETLTTGLAQKIWQKIILLGRVSGR